MSKFNVGDLVVLKSGSMRMCVEDLGDDEMVHTVWCNEGVIGRDRFNPALLPLVEDTGWFFDTELLVLAERAGLRIHEVPVDWVDDPNSTVHIVKTATDDLKGVWRVGKALATGWSSSTCARGFTTRSSRASHGPSLSRNVAMA